MLGSIAFVAAAALFDAARALPGARLSLVLAPLGVTAALALAATCIAWPLGLLVATWLRSDPHRGHPTALLRGAIGFLAKLPGVVFGMAGVALFVGVAAIGHSLAVGALALTSFLLPVAINRSEEALGSVPRALEEASRALGASRVQTWWTVTLPRASRGLAAAAVSVVQRVFAIGAPLVCTAAVFTARNHSRPDAPPLPWWDQGVTLAVRLWQTETAQTKASPHEAALLAGLLVLCAVALSALSEALRPARDQ